MLWYLLQDKPKEMLRNQVWFMWCKVCDDGGIWEIQAGASLPARRPLTHNEHSSEPRHGPTMGGYNLNTVIPSPSSSPTVIPSPSPKRDMDSQWRDIISIQSYQVQVQVNKIPSACIVRLCAQTQCTPNWYVMTKSKSKFKSKARHGPTMRGYNLNTVKPSHNGQRLTKKFNYKRILS